MLELWMAVNLFVDSIYSLTLVNIFAQTLNLAVFCTMIVRSIMFLLHVFTFRWPFSCSTLLPLPIYLHPFSPLPTIFTPSPITFTRLIKIPMLWSQTKSKNQTKCQTVCVCLRFQNLFSPFTSFCFISIKRIVQLHNV